MNSDKDEVEWQPDSQTARMSRTIARLSLIIMTSFFTCGEKEKKSTAFECLLLLLLFIDFI